jgi:hypothetical protein
MYVRILINIDLLLPMYLSQYTYISIYISRCIFRRLLSIAYVPPRRPPTAAAQRERANESQTAANSPRRVRRGAVPTLYGVLTAGVLLQGVLENAPLPGAAGAGGRSDEGQRGAHAPVAAVALHRLVRDERRALAHLKARAKAVAGEGGKGRPEYVTT